MSVGIVQFWYFTFRALSNEIIPLIPTSTKVLWALTAFSVFCVGLMIIILLFSHTLMILTNFTSLDGVKTRSICPLPFCQSKSKHV